MTSELDMSSLQRMAIISAVSTHNSMKNRTIYYERPRNDTNYDNSLNFQQHINVFIGGASLSFVITLMCVMCYCFNKSITKSSMAVYRRHLMEAANQNLDIYTIEQFCDGESYAPLSDTQPNQAVLPPSYEDVMAAEKTYLKQYGKMWTSTACCENVQLHLSNVEPSNDNIDNNAKNNVATETDMDTQTVEHVTQSKLCDNNKSEISAQHELSESSSCSDKNNFCKNRFCADTCEMKLSEKGPEIVNSAAESTLGCTSSFTINDNANNIEESESKPECETLSKCQCDHCHRCANSLTQFDVLSDNGIIRIDMSKIIDQTGLPTYDAAIKLESFGYV